MLIVEIQGSSTPKEIPALVALDHVCHVRCLTVSSIWSIAVSEELAVNVVNSNVWNTPDLPRDPSKAHLFHVIQHLSGFLLSLQGGKVERWNDEKPVTLIILISDLLSLLSLLRPAPWAPWVSKYHWIHFLSSCRLGLFAESRSSQIHLILFSNMFKSWLFYMNRFIMFQISIMSSSQICQVFTMGLAESKVSLASNLSHRVWRHETLRSLLPMVVWSIDGNLPAWRTIPWLATRIPVEEAHLTSLNHTFLPFLDRQFVLLSFMMIHTSSCRRGTPSSDSKAKHQ